MYLSFLFFRPILLMLTTLYNMLLGIKTAWSDKEKDGKKFKDDIAYQRELAQNAARSFKDRFKN